MIVTYFPSCTMGTGIVRDTTRERLFKWLQTPVEVADKKRAAAWSPAMFRHGRRLLSEVLEVSLLVFDIDLFTDADIDYISPSAVGQLGWSGMAHRTFSGGARLIFDVSRPMGRAEHSVVWSDVSNGLRQCLGIHVDPACKDASRLYFGPSISPFQAEFGHWKYVEYDCGKPIDVDDCVRSATTRARHAAAPKEPGTTRESDVPIVVLERARRYLERVPPAISGQGGHTATFIAAQAMVRGFSLQIDDAMQLLLEWNAKCEPPWTSNELRRKCSQALATGTMPVGSLLNAPRRQ